jgi:hypothetical protein
MKNIIILILAVSLSACQSSYKDQKVYYSTKNEIYRLSNDSITKKIIDFEKNNGNHLESISVLPGLILIEEKFNDLQAYKYTDYDPNKYNSDIQECRFKMIININQDTLNTKVEIKSMITCSISYSRFIGKSTEKIIKNIECRSTGAREKEIYDYINQ